MLKKIFYLTALVAFSFIPAFCGENPSYVEGKVIVEFSGEVATLKNAAGFAEKRKMKIERELPFFSRLRKKFHAVLSSDLETRDMISLLLKDPAVERVQPVYIRYPHGAVPDDPLYLKQWGLEMISAPSAWEIHTGDGSVAVAVIDSGIDYTHPDLSGNMWTNITELSGIEGIDDDMNGYTDDIFGFNFATGSADPMDINSHGSHVAGIIGACTGNATGVAGVNWSARLMALNAMNLGFFSEDKIIEAISYVVAMKRDFGENIVAINASWGSAGGSDGDMLYLAIEEAARAGIAFVASAGNDGKNLDESPLYPASYSLPNIISVAASDENDRLWNYSNYGAGSVHLSAPGSGILSTVPFFSDAVVSVGDKNYTAVPLEFAGTTSGEGINGLLVYCGLGSPEDFPPGVSGNIALIERGELYFREKVSNARDAGATSVVIYNNIPDGESGGGLIDATLGLPGDWLPAVFISMSDGLELKEMDPYPTVNIRHTVSGASYTKKSGTSMAAPFVTGAIALLSSYFPDDTVVRNAWRVMEGASPMPVETDRNRLITGGRLDLKGAFDSVLPVHGDINDDGNIDISDVIKCLRMALELDEQDLKISDINGDWQTDISDAILSLRKAIGLD